MNTVTKAGAGIRLAVRLAMVTLLSVWSSVDSAADEAPPLTHNPFSRPSSKVTIANIRAAGRDIGTDTAPVLRATMIGENIRLANVDGRILKPGDEVQGFELVRIDEEYAVFRRNGKAITVHVKPQLVEDDE